MGIPGDGGSRVGQLRKERDLTQIALARRAGVSLSPLSKIEVGDRMLTPAIARALKIPLSALYGEAEASEGARHRWMDLVEIDPTRHACAAAEQSNPLVAALAARSLAGAFLNCGDFEGGLVVVDPPEDEGPPDEPRSATGPDLPAPAQQPPTGHTRQAGRSHRIESSPVAAELASAQ